MDYITIKLPFNANGDVAKELLSTAWLFRIAAHKVLALAKQMQVLPGTKIGWVSMFRSIAYEIIPNRRYADGAVTLVMSIYESCRALGIDFRSVELSDWLMFQQSELEHPSRSITLKPGYEFNITTIRYNGVIGRVVVKPTVSRSYRQLLDTVLAGRVEYMGRVVVRDYGVRNNQLRVRGEVQVTIPLDVYYEHMARHKRNSGRFTGGVDVNTDRVNLAIIDEGGELIDHRTFWFSEASRKGFSRHSAWSIIGMRIHELLDYAYHHGVKTLFLENPEVLGRLRLMWVRNGDRKHENYNYKVSVFRSSIIEKITMKAPLYSIRVGYVNPRGTTNSTEHDELMRRYGLDRHTASAHLIAIKGLNTNNYE
ncbi:MAG: transposase [Vulcanisaeta sp.]